MGCCSEPRAKNERMSNKGRRKATPARFLSLSPASAHSAVIALGGASIDLTSVRNKCAEHNWTDWHTMDMAKPLVSDALSQVIAPLLPGESAKSKGGRPHVPNRAVRTAILFVRKTGIHVAAARPVGNGCATGARQGLGPPPSRAVGSLRARRPDRLGAGRPGCSERTRAKGGHKTWPNPTNRGKAGSKRHLSVDGRGTPPAIRHMAANRHETMQLAAMVDALPAIRRPRGTQGPRLCSDGRRGVCASDRRDGLPPGKRLSRP